MSATNKHVRTGGKQCVAVNEAIAIIRDKWTILVLGVLGRHSSLRYNQLQHEVGEISQRMLTLTLKALEENGLVKRTIFPTVPARVDYELTELGYSLVVPLRELMQWSRDHHDALVEARQAYATRVSGT